MRKRWRCFNCDEVFTRRVDAALHFGSDQGALAACEIKAHEGHLVVALRKAEEQLARYRADDSDVMRSIMTLEGEHAAAVRRAEEDGYNKGVQDMKALGLKVA